MVIKIKPTIIKFIYVFFVISIVLKMIRNYNDTYILQLLNYVFSTGLTIFCIIYPIISKKRKEKASIKSFLYFMLIFEVLVTIFNSTMDFPTGFNNIICWPLLLIIFRDYVISGEDISFLKNSIFMLYLVVAFLSCFLIFKHLAGFGNAGQVIFPTYFCITLLPLILLYEKSNFKQNILLALSVIILIATTKRVGVLISIVGLFGYIITKINISKGFKNKSMKYFIFTIFLILTISVIYIIIKNYDFQIINRFASLSSDGGSGRIYIWNIIINAYNNSTFYQKLFGHGGQSVYYNLRPGGYYRFAHNSYLEYLYDYGILGLSLITIFTFYILIKLFEYIKKRNPNSPIMMYIVTTTLFLSMFSYYYEQSFIICPVVMALGCILGDEYRVKRGDKNEN